MLSQGILPAEVQDNERVREQLNNALMLVNSAMEGAALPSYAPPPSADPYAAAAAGVASNGMPYLLKEFTLLLPHCMYWATA